MTPPVRDPDHTFQLRVRDWLELKRRNIVMQRRDYSCGAAALATVGRYYWGDNVDEDLFLRSLDSILTDEEIVDRIENGLAMSDLRRAAVDVGYQAVVGKTTFEKLLEVKVPVIVGISPEGHDHFVVFRGTDGMWVWVADPIRGNMRMPVQEFTKQWQENAILAIHKPGEKVKTTSPLHVSEEEKQFGETNKQLIRTQAQREPAMRKPQLETVAIGASDGRGLDWDEPGSRRSMLQSMHFQGVVDRAEVEAGQAEDHQHDDAHDEEADQRAEHHGQRLHRVFGLFFVALGQAAHRFDGLAAFFGHGQGVDERGGKRAAAGECDVERMAGGDVGDDLVRVADVVIAAGGAQHERHDAAQVHFDVHRQVQCPGQPGERDFFQARSDAGQSHQRSLDRARPQARRGESPRPAPRCTGPRRSRN